MQLIYYIKKNIRKYQSFICNKTNYKNCTVLGNNTKFSYTSSVILREGSSKNDIVIDDYCSIWSILISENRGKIKIGEWVNIRERTKIIACESIEIKKETIISFDVTIVDNNNHPVSPRYRRMLNHTPHYSDERQYKHSESAPIVIGENVWIGQNVRIC